MKKNVYLFPKKKYINLTRGRLFNSILGTTLCFHIFLLLFVYSFFPDSNLKIEDSAGMFGILLLCLALDFSFLKSLCLVDNKYYFYLKMFLTISILQAVVNFIVGWNSSWRYTSATFEIIYCFIFAFYTSSVFDKLMNS